MSCRHISTCLYTSSCVLGIHTLAQASGLMCQGCGESLIMSDMIDISGLDKAAVLAVLFNASAPNGMGFAQASRGPSVMTIEDAEEIIKGIDSTNQHYYLEFDYLLGRPLKLNISEDSFDASVFDYYNGGTGTARRWIDELRHTGEVDSTELRSHHKELLALRRVSLDH